MINHLDTEHFVLSIPYAFLKFKGKIENYINCENFVILCLYGQIGAGVKPVNPEKINPDTREKTAREHPDLIFYEGGDIDFWLFLR